MEKCMLQEEEVSNQEDKANEANQPIREKLIVHAEKDDYSMFYYFQTVSSIAQGHTDH